MMKLCIHSLQPRVSMLGRYRLPNARGLKRYDRDDDVPCGFAKAVTTVTLRLLERKSENKQCNIYKVYSRISRLHEVSSLEDQ